MSKIILIMCHLLPYNAFDAPYASNGLSDNNHDTNHSSTGDNNVSDTPSNNHVTFKDINPERL